MGFTDRLQHAWNAFRSNESAQYIAPMDLGASWPSNPDRPHFKYGVERSIVTSVFNRIAIDCAAVPIQHVRLDENGRFLSVIDSDLNKCLTLEANLDQTGRSLIQDIVMSLCDDGSVAVVPVNADIGDMGTIKPEELRVGAVLEWYPKDVKVRLYNGETGQKEDIWVPKKYCAVIENPLYAVMNEPNSTLKRLIHKLNILDAIDEQSGAGKLDLIVQLPYVIKTPERRKQAELRRKDIEMQLAGSKYGIAYTDGAERITQLNRPAENNLMTQIEYLTNMVYSQLGLAPSIFDGTADEKTMLNYHNRTIEPMLSAICLEIKRKFLSKTARTQGQSVEYIQNPFRLTPVGQLADLMDKLTRNEIISSNEARAIIGYKPVNDPRADELRNKNLNQNNEEGAPDPVTTRDIPGTDSEIE